jgi:hypothetical protein
VCCTAASVFVYRYDGADCTIEQEQARGIRTPGSVVFENNACSYDADIRLHYRTRCTVVSASCPEIRAGVQRDAAVEASGEVAGDTPAAAVRAPGQPPPPPPPPEAAGSGLSGMALAGIITGLACLLSVLCVLGWKQIRATAAYATASAKQTAVGKYLGDDIEAQARLGQYPIVTPVRGPLKIEPIYR